MKTVKQQNKQKQRRRIFIIIAALIIIAMAFAYVIPLTAMAAPETPPPDNGTDSDPNWPPEPGEEEQEEEKPPPPVLLIATDPPRLDVGQEIQIQVVMENIPENTLLEWSSSNLSVAGVSADGRVIAISPGYAEVAVVAGTMRASVLITVNEMKASRITIVVDETVARTGDKSYEIKVGDVIRLSAKIEPAGAKVNKFTWKVGNDRVASVSQNGQRAELVASNIGQTQVTVTADSISDSITFNIIESGVPIDRLMEYIKYGVIMAIAAIVAVVVLTWLAQRRKKELARQKALAKKRKAEAERRRREEVERRVREEAEAEKLRERREPRRPQDDERLTMRVSGAVVGAGIPESRDETGEQERPLTLDDLE